MRTFLIGAVAAVLATGPAASAAPVCNLVVDKRGDAAVGAVAAKALDIHSVDVASGKKTLVVVLRMATVRQGDDPVAAAGMSWDVTFKIAGADHRFSRRIGPNGTVLSETATAEGKALPGVTVRADGGAITWTVPRSSVAKLSGRRATFTGFFASTSAPTLAYDQAPNGGLASPAKYVDQAPSCVKPA